MIPESVIEKVLNQIDPEGVINLTAQLVRCNSVWDPQAGTSEVEAAELAARWARDRGFDVTLETVAPERPNVIVRWTAGPGSRTLMFEGHTDVVTPGNLTRWKYDPFGAQIQKGRMYGRGTNDTKGNLAGMLVAIAALKASGIPLAGSIVGGVLCDEEGMMTGVQHFIARGHADAVTAAVVCEPQDGLVCIAQKGAVRARFAVRGRMSHGAMPLSGLNPAPAVARIIDGLADLEAEAVHTYGKDPLLGWPSFTPTVVQAPSQGPPQLNVVPGEAEILVDVRTLPGQNHDTIRNSLSALVQQTVREVNARYRKTDRLLGIRRPWELDVTVRFLSDRPCTHTDRDDPVIASAVWASRQVSGKEPEFAGVPGATDGTFLWALKDIPIVTMGAGDRQVPHQVDEWVDLDQLVDTARIYALTALHYLYPGDHP
ncbi:M20 family metallopeptidase [Desulfosarcina sp.]|uniref:M20 family metallopeptidase n=1 Tax=Desulfosarcina sp. TaxID=2027861 RepID=UPI0029BDA100|nr:M20 family metallopeptidase [Desulfosarcina sp.]MDX2454254.1 M20 family metallopeptidase [Desulfosarcina sp.]MDX2491921.1 M20 family metallopeptidase [Desulfosarcina sp.]